MQAIPLSKSRLPGSLEEIRGAGSCHSKKSSDGRCGATLLPRWRLWGKTRGHLGSRLARKTESNIELSKDTNEVTTVYTSSSRHAFISKQDGPRFKWDSLAEMHVSCVPETKERNEAKRGVLSELANEIFNIP